MEWFIKTYTTKPKVQSVLDVGSYDVNGTYKTLFPVNKFKYTGLDVCNGPNVDIVLKNPYNWKSVKTDKYDIVISGQAFEHIEFFWITFTEMVRVLKKDGLLCLIVPKGFDEHRYPVDCYRFFSDSMIALSRYASLTTLHTHTNAAPYGKQTDWCISGWADTMLVAQKSYSGKIVNPDFSKYQCIPSNQSSLNKF